MMRRKNLALPAVRALAVAFLILLPFPRLCFAADAKSATVPTEENAYCSKGDVPHFGDKDGPAELPKTCFYTALEATPSPGRKLHVDSGSDLAAALDKAKCGDTLLLPAGASFPLHAFPRNNCDNQHYITVRSDVPDSQLPPEGTRISPAWAGVSSLPGRPAYLQPQGGAAKRMATILSMDPEGIVLGDHYRFIGIEWTPAPERRVARLLFTKGADHVIFDRNWMHGSEGKELTAGLGITQGGTYIAVIHSYFNNFLCIAKTGSCIDAKAIGGGGGAVPVHTVKIVDNFLEASSENMMFGGSPGLQVPEDYEIRRNYLFKPTFWNPNSPDHREPTPIVKNLFELKAMNRLLFEANYLENSWGGFSQVGTAIVLTPRNNANKKLNIVECPVCKVSNITIRYIWVRKVNQFISMANPMDLDKPAPGNSYSVHDAVVEGLRYPECGKACGGAQNLINGGLGNIPAESVMHDVSVDHITLVSMDTPHSLFIMGGPPAGVAPSQMYNISWTNTLADVGVAGAYTMGGKPEVNCSTILGGPGTSPQQRIDACWKNGVFKGNVLAIGSAQRAGNIWPKDNYSVTDQRSIGYVNLHNGLDGDYHLAATSKFKDKATDGKDPGADVDAVLGAVAGVR